MKLSIIIPVYNEEKTIGQILGLVKKIKLPSNLTKEIIVVDDGSTDSTEKILKKEKKVIKYFGHSSNLGKGAAIKTGLKISSGDLIIIQDADLEYDPNDYIKLLKPVFTKKAKVVYGSRLISYPLFLWGKNKTVLPSHLIANKFLTFLTNFLYGSNLTDMETGYKLISRDILETINIQSDGFNIEPEITAKILNKGIDIFEVPIKTKPRTYKEGKKIKWTDGISAIVALIRYKFLP